jgi:hypothetical protein
MRMICVVILVFYTYSVRSQDTSTDTTSDKPSTTTITSGETTGSSSTDGSSSTSTGFTMNSASPTIEMTTIDPNSSLSTAIYSNDSLDTTLFTSTASNTVTIGNATNFSPTNAPTTTKAPGCPPGEFPFGSGCIGPGENGGVVITAFILSIISFIGVIVSI